MIQILNAILGLTVESKDLTLWQMAARAVLVYGFTLLAIRLGSKRFMGRNTAFDAVLGVILGSVASRGVNGQAAFFPTLGVVFVLVGIHWLIAYLAWQTPALDHLIGGKASQLYAQGNFKAEALRRTCVEPNEVVAAARQHANLNDLSRVQEAYLERNGYISIVKAGAPPKVLEVKVADGVQTVRIQIDS